jgi:hypothetical protein
MRLNMIPDYSVFYLIDSTEDYYVWLKISKTLYLQLSHGTVAWNSEELELIKAGQWNLRPTWNQGAIKWNWDHADFCIYESYDKHKVIAAALVANPEPE